MSSNPDSSSLNTTSNSFRDSEIPYESKMSSPSYTIPQELHQVLLDFTVHYLIEQPGDVVSYAATYFSSLKKARQVHHPNSSLYEEEESMHSDDDMEMIPYANYKDFGRRKSVFAEAYNPEEDEFDEPLVVHPKTDEQRRSLCESVKDILLFRSLDEEQLKEVLDAMFERRVIAGQKIIRQGDDGDNFYVIESGLYVIYVMSLETYKDVKVGQYDNHGSFGELALMYNMPRAATISAVTNGMLWAMNRETFRKIVLRNAFHKRQIYEKLLESVPILRNLSSYERMNLADALITKLYQDGEVIVQQGEPADGMYFVEEGTVDITMSNNGEDKFIKRETKGGCFGELALVTHKPRAATVIANGLVKLAFLDVNAFERLLGPCMSLIERNVSDYEDQIVRIFGSKANISDTR